MIAEPLRPLARPITEFRLLEGNPRRGDVESVKRSLRRFGQRKPIVVREDGTVEAGNTTLKAALELGWTEIAVAAFGDDDATAKAFALADNRTSELGAFDLAALAAMAVEVQAADPELLEAASYTEADLNALLAGQKVPEKRTDPDAVPDAPAEPVTVAGDLWLLGPHRLLCGNAFAVELPACDAVISDPPYGMQVDTSWYGGPVGKSLGGDRVVESSHAHRGAVEWDQQGFDPAIFVLQSGNVALFGANYFCTRLPEPGSWWVWDKRATADGGVQDAYGMPFEMIWLKGKRAHRMIRHLWAGFTRKAEVADKERLHPTQKPVAVMRELIEYLTTPGQIVLDPFGGSGTTLIAAHQTGRQAALIEQDAAFCDVICRRYQEHAGTKPVLETTGQPHDFTAA